MLIRLLSILLLLSVSNMSLAMLPVIDATAISDILKQLDEMKKQSNVLSSQLSEAQRLTSDAEGHYGMGGYLNSNNDLKGMQWSPNTWDDALKMASGGNDARYQQLTQQYNDSHVVMDESAYSNITSTQQGKDYTALANTNRASTVNANHAFDDINDALDKVHELTDQIEKTDNTKSAIDLNNRITAEIAYIQLQEMKMQSVLNLQMSQQQSLMLADKTQEAQFDALPNY